jgi:hypothetical protein
MIGDRGSEQANLRMPHVPPRRRVRLSFPVNRAREANNWEAGPSDGAGGRVAKPVNGR